MTAARWKKGVYHMWLIRIQDYILSGKLPATQENTCDQVVIVVTMVIICIWLVEEGCVNFFRPITKICGTNQCNFRCIETQFKISLFGTENVDGLWSRLYDKVWILVFLWSSVPSWKSKCWRILWSLQRCCKWIPGEVPHMNHFWTFNPLTLKPSL